jgi:hypothetical protein
MASTPGTAATKKYAGSDQLQVRDFPAEAGHEESMLVINGCAGKHFQQYLIDTDSVEVPPRFFLYTHTPLPSRQIPNRKTHSSSRQLYLIYRVLNCDGLSPKVAEHRERKKHRHCRSKY